MYRCPAQVVGIEWYRMGELKDMCFTNGDWRRARGKDIHPECSDCEYNTHEPKDKSKKELDEEEFGRERD